YPPQQAYQPAQAPVQPPAYQPEPAYPPQQAYQPAQAPVQQPAYQPEPAYPPQQAPIQQPEPYVPASAVEPEPAE
ncbi:hypothetical protein, partial [Klebsiella grimontii]